MPSKPTNLPQWSGAGTPPTATPGATVDPPGANKVAGIPTGGKMPAQWMNWLLFTIYQWIYYLSTGNMESTWSFTAAAGSAAVGIQGTGDGTKAGLYGIGGATNGPGVKGVGGATNGNGAEFAGTGTGAGIVGTGGATNAYGVEGVGGNTYPGVYGHNPIGEGVRGIGGGSAVPGVYGFNHSAGGRGVCGEVDAATGDAVLAFAANGSRSGRFSGGVVCLPPNPTLPGTPLVGDMYFDTGSNTVKVYVSAGGGQWKTLTPS